MGYVIWIAEVFKFTSGCSWATLPVTGNFQAIWYSLPGELGIIITWSLLLFNIQQMSTGVRYCSSSIKGSTCLQPVCILACQWKETQGMKYILETYCELCLGPFTWLAFLGGCGNFHREWNSSQIGQVTPTRKSFDRWVPRPGREGIITPRVIKVSNDVVPSNIICRRQHLERFLVFFWQIKWPVNLSILSTEAARPAVLQKTKQRIIRVSELGRGGRTGWLATGHRAI